MRNQFPCSKTSLDGRLSAGGLRIRSANPFEEALGKDINTNARIEPHVQTVLSRAREYLVR